MQVTLRKKQLTVSFVEHFKQNNENTIWVKFKFYNLKLVQERCFIRCVCSTGLCKGCSAKEAIDSFFRWTIWINSWKHKIFRSYFFSLMLENLIKNSISDFLLAILAYAQGGLWKKQLITSFVKHFIESHKSTIRITFHVNSPKLSQEGCLKHISTINATYKVLCERSTW